MTYVSSAFSFSRELIIHKRKHTGEKPYACDTCAYASSRCDKLVIHKRKHTGEKPYACDTCVYASSRYDKLVLHKRIHSSAKPYVCNQCGLSCSRSENLQSHKARMHSVERPFKCDNCDYVCLTRRELKKHYVSHMSIKSFKCEDKMCDFATKSANRLMRHTKNIHTVKGIQRQKKKGGVCNIAVDRTWIVNAARL